MPGRDNVLLHQHISGSKECQRRSGAGTRAPAPHGKPFRWFLAAQELLPEAAGWLCSLKAAARCCQACVYTWEAAHSPGTTAAPEGNLGFPQSSPVGVLMPLCFCYLLKAVHLPDCQFTRKYTPTDAADEDRHSTSDWLQLHGWEATVRAAPCATLPRGLTRTPFPAGIPNASAALSAPHFAHNQKTKQHLYGPGPLGSTAHVCVGGGGRGQPGHPHTLDLEHHGATGT